MHVDRHVHRNVRNRCGRDDRPGSRPGSGGDGFDFGQAQLAGDQAGEQGVAKGGEGLRLPFVLYQPIKQRGSDGRERIDNVLWRHHQRDGTKSLLTDFHESGTVSARLDVFHVLLAPVQHVERRQSASWWHGDVALIDGDRHLRNGSTGGEGGTVQQQP